MYSLVIQKNYILKNNILKKNKNEPQQYMTNLFVFVKYHVNAENQSYSAD